MKNQTQEQDTVKQTKKRCPQVEALQKSNTKHQKELRVGGVELTIQVFLISI